MFIQPYHLDELKFAWCYRVYYRWRTHRASPQPALARLDQPTLDALLQPYGIHVLEATVNKTDFVPDHVHLAVRFHPSVSPAAIVVALINAAEERLWSNFPEAAIRAGVQRLWQPSAYLGTFGELQSAKIPAYLRRWKRQATK